MIKSYVDLHTHILPGIDDGPADVERSANMVSLLHKQGVGTIVLTPHFDAASTPMEQFLQRRERAFERLCERVGGEYPVTLIPACEAYLSDLFFVLEDIKPLCFGGHYLLVEFPYEVSADQAQRWCDELMDRYVVTPVFAHVERYHNLFRSRRHLEMFCDMGCLLQSNLSSLETFGMRHKLLPLYQKGLISLIGTDCHNLTTRPPDFLPYVDLLEKKCGRAVVEKIIQTSRAVCGTNS